MPLGHSCSSPWHCIAKLESHAHSSQRSRVCIVSAPSWVSSDPGCLCLNPEKDLFSAGSPNACFDVATGHEGAGSVCVCAQVLVGCARKEGGWVWLQAGLKQAWAQLCKSSHSAPGNLFSGTLAPVGRSAPGAACVLPLLVAAATGNNLNTRQPGQ